MRELLTVLGISFLLVGCVQVPAPKPQSQTQTQPSLGTTIGSTTTTGRETVHSGGSVEVSAYGTPPHRYATAIKSYFTTKLKRGAEANYKFSKPKRAYKRKGLAYGGDLAWKGWLVETLVAVPTRTGRYLTPRPYMVLFSGEQIVEDILGNSHKLVTKVDK